MEDKVRVLIRLRPDHVGLNAAWTVENNTLYHNNSENRTGYSCFKKVYDLETNKNIYENEVANLVDAAYNGKSCTVFAYGQTGSGKTYTMMGNKNESGLIKLAVDDIFKKEGIKLKIKYLEIYNEKIFDLIVPTNKVAIFNVGVKQEIRNAAVFVADCKNMVFEMIEKCETRRRKGYTEFNSVSSRSHTIFMMTLESKCTLGTINMIDLAGSEKATGDKERRMEGSFINKSLLALGTVVNSMKNKNVVGFRDSKLTRILQSSMSGNLQLVALCMISPLKKCVDESISTLNFAARLAKIKLEGKKEKIEVEIEKYSCPKCKCHEKNNENATSKKESDLDSIGLELLKKFYFIKNGKPLIDFSKNDYSNLAKNFTKNASIDLYDSLLLSDESADISKYDYIEKLKGMDYCELIRECIINKEYDLNQDYNVMIDKNKSNNQTNKFDYFKLDKECSINGYDLIKEYDLDRGFNFKQHRDKKNDKKNEPNYSKSDECDLVNEYDLIKDYYFNDDREKESKDSDGQMSKDCDLNSDWFLNKDYDFLTKNKYVDKDSLDMYIENDQTKSFLNSDTINSSIYKTNSKQCNMEEEKEQRTNKIDLKRVVDKNNYLVCKIELLKDHIFVLEKIMDDNICGEQNKKTAFLLERKMFFLRSKILEKRFKPENL